MFIPPSGHMAGIWARSDTERGVHKAPANEIINWVQGLTLDVTAEWQAILNPTHVNCLRQFSGRGLRVYGARTLSSNTAWRFLNVRRLLILIEKSISMSIQWAVFEPNDFYLRQTLILAISSFLQALWQRGLWVPAIRPPTVPLPGVPLPVVGRLPHRTTVTFPRTVATTRETTTCLLYTSDAADERSSVDLGGRRIIKKKMEHIPDALLVTVL